MIVLGDESGYTAGEVQKVKLAAIEAEWETQPPPASFTVFGLPNQLAEHTDYAIHVPWVLGLIATRSIDQPVVGLKELKADHRIRIMRGISAYEALQKIKAGDQSPTTLRAFEDTKRDLGYGLLLKKYAPNVVDATTQQIQQAVDDSIPQVAPMFWCFRLMVGFGMLFLATFALAFYFCARRTLTRHRWLLKLALYSIPLPWLAAELGWIVAEYGRQPWTISEVLPTYLSASSLSTGQVYFSLAGFLGFYTLLLVVEMYLMIKYARLGPSSLGTGQYHHEQAKAP